MNRIIVWMESVVFLFLSAAALHAGQSTPKPGPDFVWAGQWVPCSHPIAVAKGLGCTNAAPVLPEKVLPPPPASDEYEMVESYPGTGIMIQVLKRTNNPGFWFRVGERYTTPYKLIVQALDIVRRADGEYYYLLEVISTPQGEPRKGAMLLAPIYSPRTPFMTEEEFGGPFIYEDPPRPREAFLP